MAGPSLFDAAALPSWLGGTATPSTPLLQETPAGASGLAANTLVDPNVLPQWMRDARPAQAEPVGPQASSTVSEWLANPVTDEPLPGFLDQIYSAADVPRLDQAAPGAGMPGEPIVDAGALPDWLRASGDQAAGQGMHAGMNPPGYLAPVANGVANGVPMPITPAPFGAPFDGPSIGAPQGESDGDAAGPLFSAKDLVEPDALPDWARQNQGQVIAPSFATTDGDPTARWSEAQPDFAPQSDPNAAPMWSEQGWSEQGEEAALAATRDDAGEPGRSWPPRSGQRPPIPDAELPSWLREGQPAAAAMAGMDGMDARGAPPDGPDGYAGFDEFQGFDAGDMPMDPMEMDPMEMDPMEMPPGEPRDGRGGEHYADRFGNEMPGGSGHFGYEYDYGQAGEVLAPDAAPDLPPPSGKAGKGGKNGKRRGFFRRK